MSRRRTASSTLLAQRSTPQINETVTDISNTVVAGATVTAINNATGATIRQTTTAATRNVIQTGELALKLYF